MSAAAAAADRDRATRPLHPAYLYAFEKLGYFVTDWNIDMLTNEQVDEWEAALDEWIAEHPNEDPP